MIPRCLTTVISTPSTVSVSVTSSIRARRLSTLPAVLIRLIAALASASASFTCMTACASPSSISLTEPNPAIAMESNTSVSIGKRYSPSRYSTVSSFAPTISMTAAKSCMTDT